MRIGRSDRLNFFQTTNTYQGIRKKSTNNVSKLLDYLDFTIDPFFTTEELDQLARETQFVQREGKINGSLFFDLIVFHSENLKAQSLNDMSVVLKDEYDIQIRKQSLHDRFNHYALAFLKEALEKLLHHQLELESTIFGNLKGFNRILIKDSTCFQIDASLAQYYAGSGGAGSDASVRIQFEYDIVSGCINDLTVNAFNNQDAKDSLETIGLIDAQDLIIRDLAYMGLQVLQTIQIKNAFYLCRANPNVHIFQKSKEAYEKIDFVEITRYMKTHNIDSLEKEVYLGSKEKYKTRLILYLLPEEEYAKRMRKAKQYNKKKNRKALSKEYKAKAALNLFITNAGTEQIPMDKVWDFYRLRWQIELIFKIWKSICNVEKVKKVKKHRLECYIYAKLVLIVLSWQILWRTARRLFVNEGKALSFFKASKTLIGRKIDDLRKIFILGKGSIQGFMDQFYELSKNNHLLEKRREEPTSMQRMLICLDSEYMGIYG